MITLKRLEYFAKVVETRNITRAAEQLHIAQPALGTHMRELEAALGVPLLSRHSRGVDPTPAGRLLLERSRQIFELVARTQDDVRRADQAAPVRFNLGLTSSIMLLIGSDLLLTLKRRYPHIDLQLYENPSFLLVDALERKDIDAALAYSVAPRPGLSTAPVLKEQLLLAVRADLAPSSAPVSMDEVLAHELVLGNERDVARRLVEASAFEKGAQPRIQCETHSITSQRDLVLRGAAAAVMPLGAIVRELERGEVVARPITDPGMHITLFIVRRQAPDEASRQYVDQTDPIVRACVDMIAARLGELGSPV